MEEIWLSELLCRLKQFLLVVIQYVLWLLFCTLRSYITLQLISDFNSISGSVERKYFVQKMHKVFLSLRNAIFTHWNPYCIM